jgi:hypothetical protein
MVAWLRIIVSCFCLVLCVLFAALWVRGWFYYDIVERVAVVSETKVMRTWLIGLGAVIYQEYPRTHSGSEARWKSSYRPTADWRDNLYPPFLYFRWEYNSRRTYVAFPTGFAAVMNAFGAYFAKPKPRRQFGLRDIFVLSTVVTLIVGPLTYWLRSISP